MVNMQLRFQPLKDEKEEVLTLKMVMMMMMMMVVLLLLLLASPKGCLNCRNQIPRLAHNGETSSAQRLGW